jgi:hypothetical protein
MGRVSRTVWQYHSSLTMSRSCHLLCEGGRTGTSAEYSQKCGVYIGRWRPNSKLNPDLRARVAVKVMAKNRIVNCDTQHLVHMDFPYVNHFLGQFDSSKQLGIAPDSDLTIMVSSYCPGGDHWSALHCPVLGGDSYIMYLKCLGDHRFCFVNPDSPDDELVHHTMTEPVIAALGSKLYSLSAYLCVCSDAVDASSAVICRVSLVDQRSFNLWISNPVCTYRDRLSAKVFPQQFDVPFVADARQYTRRCFMLVAVLNSTAESVRQFLPCMPRPNVAFLRAFAVQLLRALGYCHSRKLTSHNGAAPPVLALAALV